MANEKIKFYRGSSYDPSKPQADGVVFQNKGRGTTEKTVDKKMGSIYEGENIVGTTCADKLVLTEAITVAGLDGQFGAGGYINDGVIPAGTPISEILQKILCKELWPSALKLTKTASLTTAVVAPTPSLSAASKQNGLVEIGDTITVASLNANESTTGGNTQTIVGTMTYGYSKSDNNTQEFKDKTISSSRTTPVANPVDTYSLSVTYPAGGSKKATPNAKHSLVTIPEFTFIAIDGVNSVATSETGVGFTASVPEIAKIYACSNLKNTHSDDQAAITYGPVKKADLSVAADTDSKSASLTGIYPTWTNGSYYGTDANKNTKKDFKYGTEEKDKIMINYKTPSTIYIGFGTSDSSKRPTIYVPTGVNVTFNAWNATAGKYDATALFKKEGTEQIQSVTNVSVDKWVLGDAGANTYKITIG